MSFKISWEIYKYSTNSKPQVYLTRYTPNYNKSLDREHQLGYLQGYASSDGSYWIILSKGGIHGHLYPKTEISRGQSTDLAKAKKAIRQLFKAMTSQYD